MCERICLCVSSTFCRAHTCVRHLNIPTPPALLQPPHNHPQLRQQPLNTNTNNTRRRRRTAPVPRGMHQVGAWRAVGGPTRWLRLRGGGEGRGCVLCTCVCIYVCVWDWGVVCSVYVCVVCILCTCVCVLCVWDGIGWVGGWVGVFYVCMYVCICMGWDWGGILGGGGAS
jgi:hypothetical protein